MANLRKPVPFERHGPDCTDQGNRRKADHAHAAGISALGSSFQDFYAGRFRLTLWLLERHSQSGAQRTRAALMLVLGNILLAILALMLSILAMLILNGTFVKLVLGCLSLILFCVLLSSIFALLAAARWRMADRVDVSSFFQSGAGSLVGSSLLLSETGFRDQFHQATRQQMLEGAISTLYKEMRHRVRQERLFRWAGVAYALALILYVLMSSVGIFAGII